MTPKKPSGVAGNVIFQRQRQVDKIVVIVVVVDAAPRSSVVPSRNLLHDQLVLVETSVVVIDVNVDNVSGASTKPADVAEQQWKQQQQQEQSLARKLVPMKKQNQKL